MAPLEGRVEAAASVGFLTRASVVPEPAAQAPQAALVGLPAVVVAAAVAEVAAVLSLVS
jgi:hypothetical protein